MGFFFFWGGGGEGRGGGGCRTVVRLRFNLYASIAYFMGRSAQTVRSVTLRQKLLIKPVLSPGHSLLTPGKPVPALIM